MSETTRGVLGHVKPALIIYQGPGRTEIRIASQGPMLFSNGVAVADRLDMLTLIEIFEAANKAYGAGQVETPSPEVPF